MANEKVSQMPSLSAAEASVNDLLMIVDTSALESKRISMGDVITFISSTGSFTATTAVSAQTASFVLGQNVFGQVQSASIAQTVVSASHANRADQAILATTASFALSTVVSNAGTTLFTGSTYPITASSTISASNALVSTFASSSNVALSLKYTGGNNGTASYSILSTNAITSSFTLSASNAIFANTASFVKSAQTASYLTTGIPLVRAYAWVTFSGVTGKFNTDTLYQSYNISSFTYTDTAVIGHLNADHFMVEFETPLNNSNYVFIGNIVGVNTTSGINGFYTASVNVNPSHNRYTTGFTCSVVLRDTAQSTFYLNGASLTFQLLGLP